jgi:hypothetical protein
MKRALLHTACALLLCCASCAGGKPPHTQFHRPKYDVSTGTRAVPGKPAVRQTWFSRFWFWQQRDRRPNTQD